MSHKRHKSQLKRRRKKEAQRLRQMTPIAIDLTIAKFSFPTVHHIDNGSTEQKCYAAILGNCSGGISREHYISKNILEQFENGLPSSGIPWITGEERALSPNDLVAKCLCEHHNSALSPLDSFAGEVFKHITKFHLKRRVLLKIDGALLELWMLKALIGVISTGKFIMHGKTFTKSDIPEDLVKTLFKGKALQEDLGLYLRYSVGDKIEFKKHITIAPVFLKNEIAGLTLRFGGIEFLLSLKPKNENFNLTHPSAKNLMRHPRRVNNGDGIGGIEFVWRET